MNEIEDHNSDNHHGSVEGNEKPLMGDKIARPALYELDRAIDAADVDTGDGKHHRREKWDDRAGCGLQEAPTDRAADEFGGQDDKGRDRGELEDDTADHCVRAGLGALVGVVQSRGGHAAADGLDDQRDDVAGAEDPEVQARAND